MTDFLVKIEELCINMFLGLHDFEKEKKQRVFIDVDIVVSSDTCESGDFFDYDKVVDYIRTFNDARIETQEELVTRIYEFTKSLGCKSVQVYSRKPDVYPDCKSVGILTTGTLKT